jgi:Glycosyltransferase
MRIFYITSSTNISGGSRQALYLAQGMRERGHEVVFFIQPHGALKQLAASMGAELEWRDLPESPLAWKKALESAMRPGEPLIMHAFHNKAVKMTALLGTLWRLTGRPVACVAHRGVVYPPRNPLPYLLPGIRCFAVNSQACLDTLPLLWRKEAGRVIPNGVPDSKITPATPAPEVRASLDLPEGAVIVGTVGNNEPVKGMETLFRAFARLQQENRYLVLVGLRKEKWMPLCEQLGIAQRVRIVAKTENVANYLQIYTLFVLPSLLESSPNTLLEALRMGLPAVGSRVGGVPECLDDSRLLAEPGNEEDLGAKMAFALETPGLLAQAAERNALRGREYALERRMETMETLYRTLLP